MKHIALLSLIGMLMPGAGNAQEVHRLPFAGSGNVIELSVENSGSVPATEVTVEARRVPPWLRFSAPAVSLDPLLPGAAAPLRFTFDVGREAPVGRRHTLVFLLGSSTGQEWTKEITVEVAAPEAFELLQNYPNPFNPSTTIAFQLPRNARVSLKIYNVLAQEVAEVAGGDFGPGYHEVEWDGGRFSSGMYIYQLAAKGTEGETTVMRKSMMLVK